MTTPLRFGRDPSQFSSVRSPAIYGGARVGTGAGRAMSRALYQAAARPPVRGGRRGLLIVSCWFAAWVLPADVGAVQAPDTLELSLDAALERGTSESEEVQLARAEVAVAESRLGSARSAVLPQLSTSLVYTRTLASMFNTGESFQLPDSLRFEPDSTAPLADRVSYLERRTPLAGLGGLGQLFSDLPFGQEHAYTAGVSASQVLYAGGSVRAGIAMAQGGLAVAEASEREGRAQLELDVKRAYWGAVLAGEFQAIAEAALEQAERFLAQEQLRHEAGRASELDVLRAEVTAANLRPGRVQAVNAASLAMLNLKRLINLPLDAPVRLTTELTRPAAPTVAEAADLDELLTRPAVVAAEAGVQVREAQVRMSRAAFLPSIALQMSYSRLAFPNRLFDLAGDWRSDWTGTVAVQLPLFQGGRRWAELQQAQAELDRSRLQLQQLQEAVELEYRQAARERERAWSEIEARERTVEQAQRVHDLTVLRYERGLGTQLEVSEARLGLLSARTNLAQALADYQLAQAAVERALAGGGTDGGARQ